MEIAEKQNVLRIGGGALTIKLKKKMKKWLLSGCLLALTACGQVPQEQIDSLKETIADYEENGAGAEMPEEFRALQDSFAEVEKSVEAEKEKMFSSYSAAEQKLAQIEKQLDDMAFAISARSEQFQKVYNKFAREASLGLLMYASLPKDKARSLPKEMKDDLQRTVQPMPLLRELMKAETYAQKQEILGPQVEKLEKLNEMMKPWLSEQKYDECLKKVEAQMKKANLSNGGQIGFGSF